MKNPAKTIYGASLKVLGNRKYLLLFFSLALIMMAVFISIPVFSIPGNTLTFQLSIFTFWNYILIGLVSASIGLMISMQIYNFKLKKSLKNAGKGVVGGFSGIVAGIFGTASCSSCVAALFGFLGLGAVFFLIKYQWYVVGISSFFVLLSVYFTSSSIEKNCEACI